MLLWIFNLQKQERDLLHELNEIHEDLIRQDLLNELKKVQEQIDLLLSDQDIENYLNVIQKRRS